MRGLAYAIQLIGLGMWADNRAFLEMGMGLAAGTQPREVPSFTTSA